MSIFASQSLASVSLTPVPLPPISLYPFPGFSPFLSLTQDQLRQLYVPIPQSPVSVSSESVSSAGKRESSTAESSPPGTAKRRKR
jgi:hypothetical protein